MRCKNCRTKMKPRMAFCPKCGTPVTNGKRVALSDKQKKIFLIAGIAVLLVLMAGGILFAVKRKRPVTEETAGEQQNITEFELEQEEPADYPVVTQESMETAQNQGPENMYSFNLEAMDHQPAEKVAGTEWNSDLFYQLEGISDSGEKGIGTLGTCTLSQYCMWDTATDGEILYEVYSDPDSGQIYKITSVREYEEEPLDIIDYYYRDGKPYFVFWREDNAYTPSFASIKIPGTRFYFENDALVQVRTVLKDSLKVSQTTLKPQGRSDYEEFDYFTAPDEIRAQYDAYELEWLNRSYNTYDAIMASGHIGKICGTVTTQRGLPVSGCSVLLQNQNSGQIVCSMQTDENGKYTGYVYQDDADYQLYMDGGGDYQDLYIHEIHVTQGTGIYEYDPVLITNDSDSIQIKLHTLDATTRNSKEGTEAKALSGQLVIRKGMNTRKGEAVYTGSTDESGQAEITLPRGHYTIEAVVDGYERTWKSIMVNPYLEEGEDALVETSVYLIPALSEGESAFVLTWRDDAEVDLDLTLFTSLVGDDGNMSHIGEGITTDDAQDYLVSDNSSGCEVVYGSAAYGQGPLKVYVCNYTQAQRHLPIASWRDLDIHLYSYQPDGQVMEFRPDENAGGVVWEAAAVRNGSISAYNRFYDNIEGKSWWQDEKGDFVLSKEDEAIFRGIAYDLYGDNKWTPEEWIEEWTSDIRNYGSKIDLVTHYIFLLEDRLTGANSVLYENTGDIEKYLMKGRFGEAGRIYRELFGYDLKPEDFEYDSPGNDYENTIVYNRDFNDLVFVISDGAGGMMEGEQDAVVSVKYDPEQHNYMVLVNLYSRGSWGIWKNYCTQSTVFRVEPTMDNSFGYRILSIETHQQSDDVFDDFFEDKITIPYLGENVTCSEFFESTEYRGAYTFADIDNDYQNELVLLVDSNLGKVFGALDITPDGDIQIVDLESYIYSPLAGGICDVEGEIWISGSDGSHMNRNQYEFCKFVEDEVVDQISLIARYNNPEDRYNELSYFLYNDQKITMVQYEAILNKFYEHRDEGEYANTWDPFRSRAEEETYGWKPKYTADEWRGF